MRRFVTLELLLAALLLAAGCAAEYGASDDDAAAADCEDSACGCLQEIYFEYAAVVTAADDDTPIEDVQLFCEGEPQAVDISDLEGEVQFSTRTYVSDLCGLERCRTLRFHDPHAEFEDAWVDAVATNGATIRLWPID